MPSITGRGCRRRNRYGGRSSEFYFREGTFEATKRPPGIARNRQAEVLSWLLDIGLLTAIDLETIGLGWQCKHQV